MIIKASWVGIITNFMLAGFKAFIGIASHSIAITTDAINNVSDAASSVITIAGTKLAGKESDRKHPFGYGRIEYITATVISLLVLYAGIKAVSESIEKIINPVAPEYNPVSLVIILGAVFAKIILGKYVTGVGKKAKSDALVNSGKDALMDSAISSTTLVAAVIYIKTGISLEAWLGAIIGLVIVKAGYSMLAETMSKILGERADVELARNIKAAVKKHPEVINTYDLILHDYGPDSHTGSIHIEISDSMTATEIDKLSRRIMIDVYREYKVALTAIGVYSQNTTDPEAMADREKVREIVLAVPHVLQMHGFYIDRENKEMRFDIVVSFDSENRRATYNEAMDRVIAEYKGYKIQGAMDMDYSELN